MPSHNNIKEGMLECFSEGLRGKADLTVTSSALLAERSMDLFTSATSDVRGDQPIAVLALNTSLILQPIAGVDAVM